MLRNKSLKEKENLYPGSLKPRNTNLSDPDLWMNFKMFRFHWYQQTRSCKFGGLQSTPDQSGRSESSQSKCDVSHLVSSKSRHSFTHRP